MKIKMLIASAIVLLSSAAQAGTINYGTGQYNPWGNTTNNEAMDSAFGAGNWNLSHGYSTSVFTDADFVFLDGGDSNANEFSSFLANNSAVIANYVANGGHLFLNAAPNQGGSFDMGFGVQLNYPGFGSNVTVTEAGVAAGLTEGGLATNYSGSAFSHAFVSGTGISNLIMDENGRIVFGAMQFGKGFVAFGGETTTNFHYPSGNSAALRVNELRYVANAETSNDVPEPASLALIGMGLLAAGAARRKAAK